MVKPGGILITEFKTSAPQKLFIRNCFKIKTLKKIMSIWFTTLAWPKILYCSWRPFFHFGLSSFLLRPCFRVNSTTSEIQLERGLQICRNRFMSSMGDSPGMSRTWLARKQINHALRRCCGSPNSAVLNSPAKTTYPSFFNRASIILNLRNEVWWLSWRYITWNYHHPFRSFQMIIIIIIIIIIISSILSSTWLHLTIGKHQPNSFKFPNKS